MTWSHHAYGNAVDIGWKKNPYKVVDVAKFEDVDVAKLGHVIATIKVNTKDINEKLLYALGGFTPVEKKKVKVDSQKFAAHLIDSWHKGVGIIGQSLWAFMRLDFTEYESYILKNDLPDDFLQRWELE